MLDLTPETEALARSLAEARGRSVDETVREALEMRDRQPPSHTSTAMSADMIARRRARIRRIVQEIAALPDLDHRSSEEIMDDLNPL